MKILEFSEKTMKTCESVNESHKRSELSEQSIKAYLEAMLKLEAIRDAGLKMSRYGENKQFNTIKEFEIADLKEKIVKYDIGIQKETWYSITEVLHCKREMDETTTKTEKDKEHHVEWTCGRMYNTLLDHKYTTRQIDTLKKKKEAIRTEIGNSDDGSIENKIRNVESEIEFLEDRSKYEVEFIQREKIGFNLEDSVKKRQSGEMSVEEYKAIAKEKREEVEKMDFTQVEKEIIENVESYRKEAEVLLDGRAHVYERIDTPLEKQKPKEYIGIPDEMLKLAKDVGLTHEEILMLAKNLEKEMLEKEKDYEKDKTGDEDKSDK